MPRHAEQRLADELLIVHTFLAKLVILTYEKTT